MKYTKKTLIENFSCHDNETLKIEKSALEDALLANGEHFVIELSYDDVRDELHKKKLRNKLAEALSIFVCFEDDGKHFEDIASFSRYMYEHTQEEQHLQFGIKNTKKLSNKPVKILLCGIFPINQISIAIAPHLYRFIQTNKNVLEPKFRYVRELLSKELNIPILPVEHYEDTTLQANEIVLKDTKTKTTLGRCHLTTSTQDEQEMFQLIDNYLLAIISIYKKLMPTNQSKEL